jgi:hypothetical protein
MPILGYLRAIGGEHLLDAALEVPRELERERERRHLALLLDRVDGLARDSDGNRELPL